MKLVVQDRPANLTCCMQCKTKIDPCCPGTFCCVLHLVVPWPHTQRTQKCVKWPWLPNMIHAICCDNRACGPKTKRLGSPRGVSVTLSPNNQKRITSWSIPPGGLRIYIKDGESVDRGGGVRSKSFHGGFGARASGLGQYLCNWYHVLKRTLHLHAHWCTRHTLVEVTYLERI